ncbi:MAG: hypothetical protein OXQ29_04770 [Rhodospirillaceae bacterium]|nr:hypothetical protein [Rhodospirillaceae bacterium]
MTRQPHSDDHHDDPEFQDFWRRHENTLRKAAWRRTRPVMMRAVFEAWRESGRPARLHKFELADSTDRPPIIRRILEAIARA